MKKQPPDIRINDYAYELPAEKIAAFPLEKRDQSKLLVYKDGMIENDCFYNLPGHLLKGSTLILNDTRVIEARIFFQKETGGVIEIFCLEPYGESIEESLQRKEKVQWKCFIGGASKWKAGQLLQKQIFINQKEILLSAKYIDKKADSFIIEFTWPNKFSFAEVIHAAGNIPLPPYIKREPNEADKERYQTIFSKQEGSVAAPTAALHFTQETFSELQNNGINIDYVTLHVGAGTFKPVKSETIAGHLMHEEPFSVTKDLLKKLITSENVIAVGTTSLRTIESLYWMGVKLANKLIVGDWSLQQWEAYELEEKYPPVHYKESLKAVIDWMNKHEQTELHCRTSIIIVPGYQFQIPTALITNFHQPQSTLLLLVSAFIGKDWERVYQHALQNDYRFLSYGDSSLLWRNT